MPKPTVVGPLREANLGDQCRLDPCVATPTRRAARERRRRAPERLQALPDGVERGVVEAGADAADVDERVALVEPDVERAEACPRALGRRVSADDELLAELALDLDPLVRPPAGVTARHALGHDALDALLARGVVEGLAVLEDVRAVVDDTAGGDEQGETLLARLERQRPQIAAVERERIEEHRGDRRGTPRALDVRGAREMHACLQALKARTTTLVERDDLAVEQESLERQRP